MRNDHAESRLCLVPCRNRPTVRQRARTDSSSPRTTRMRRRARNATVRMACSARPSRNHPASRPMCLISAPSVTVKARRPPCGTRATRSTSSNGIRESTHGKGLAKGGLTVTAMCTSCHTAHSVLPRSDSLSSINSANVPATCGKCQHGMEEQFAQAFIRAASERPTGRFPCAMTATARTPSGGRTKRDSSSDHGSVRSLP